MHFAWLLYKTAIAHAASKCLNFLLDQKILTVQLDILQCWWHGRVITPDDETPATVAIRALNDKIKDDPRVEAVLLDSGDGIFVCSKK